MREKDDDTRNDNIKMNMNLYLIKEIIKSIMIK